MLSPRRRRRYINLALVGLVSFGLAAEVGLAGTPAAASSSAGIVTGQSIAGVQLGETEAQVEHTLGPLSYSETANLFHPRRQESLHLHFTNGKLDLIGLFAADGQKTATGIEVGSTRRQFRRAYPRAHCMPEGPRESLYCYITAHSHGYETHTEFRFSETGQLEQIGLAYTLGPEGPLRIARASRFALHSVGYLRTHCPIAVPVNVFTPGRFHDMRHGVAVHGQRDGGVVKYTWTLNRGLEFCGIVGVWVLPNEISLRPTSLTADGGEYVDTSVGTSTNGLHLNEFLVYARPRARAAQATGIRLTGQLSHLNLCTPYTYTVTVRPSKSYRDAVVTLNTPAATVPYQPKTVNLTAGRSWTGRFTLYFNKPDEMSRGLLASVSVLPPHRSYIGLYSRRYAVALAPGQGEGSRPVGSGCGPLPPNFGS